MKLVDPPQIKICVYKDDTGDWYYGNIYILTVGDIASYEETWRTVGQGITGNTKEEAEENAKKRVFESIIKEYKINRDKLRLQTKYGRNPL